MDRVRLLYCLSALLLVTTVPVANADESWLGRPVAEYIEALGLPVIYSSDVVPPGLLVEREPTASDPEYALRQVLAASGLALIAGPDASLLVVTAREAASPDSAALTGTIVTPDGKRVTGAEVLIADNRRHLSGAAGEYLIRDLPPGRYRVRARQENSSSAEREVILEPGQVLVLDLTLPLAPRALPDLVVTSSLHRLVFEAPGSYTFLDGDSLMDLPNLADDPLRAGERLPGVSGGGLSARTHVRGGEETETLVLFDGLRLYEPFHLKDFQNVISTLDMRTVGGVDYYSGGYPARYGDRMSAVMDISVRQPAVARRTELSLDFFNTGVTSLGTFEAGDGAWLASLRRGNLDLLLDAFRPEYGSPSYLDLLLHLERDVGNNFRVSANALLSHDKIGIRDSGSTSMADAKYDNRYLWFKVAHRLRENLSASTVLSASLITNERSGVVDLPDVVTGAVSRDEREFRIFGLKQDWEYLRGPDSVWRAGFDLKHVEGDYDYSSTREVAALFSLLADGTSDVRQYSLSPGGGQFSAYVENRWRITDWLTSDLGLRWDQQTYTTASDDEQISPRLSLLLTPSAGREIRLSWGRFYQAQEVSELQVADDLPDFQEAQRSEHLILSLVQRVGARYRLRLELYRKKMRSLSPRFENSLDPLVLLPELQPDRTRIDAESATARGAEILITQTPGSGTFSWWASYSWSEALDQLDEGKVPRSWDQTHAYKLGLDWSAGPWALSLAGTLHTGWPKTRLVLVTAPAADDTTEARAVLEPRNRRRHSDFHRLDMRLSRSFMISRGALEAYLEVTNLYNARNPCCLEYTPETLPDGTILLREEVDHWLPLIPSLGVVWSFE